MSTFGQRLKELRKDNKLSQVELADAIGVAQSSIGNYERGDRIPDAETIVRYAKYFKVSTDYLLGLTPFKQPYSPEILDKFEKILKLKIELQKLINKVGDVP